jgi:hypothetical protein
MKKLIFILLILVTVCSCKKTKFAPEGPTDVRVQNLSDQSWVEVIVNTSGGIDTLGNIAAHDTSAYFRFAKAYVKAEITATINGEKYSTGSVIFTYLTYIGQEKITYKVWISDVAKKKLEIFDVIYDEPLLDLK